MVRLYGLLGTSSHTRASAVWLGRRMTRIAWQTRHAALVRAYRGVPWVVRIVSKQLNVPTEPTLESPHPSPRVGECGRTRRTML